MNSNKVNWTEVSDEKLVELFQNSNGRHDVFLEIVGRFKEKVYYHVRRIVVSHDLADDAAQTTFIRVWENLANFRNDCALYTWIYRIATNEALMLLRKQRKNISLEDASVEMEALIDTGSNLSGEVIARKLAKAVLQLPEKQRLVFQLKYFEDLKYEQVADITGTSIGALKASYFHAVKKIEEFLGREI